jgi:HEXXH motif-containing protein
LRLDEDGWIYGGGVSAQWRWVAGRRLGQARRSLVAAAARFSRGAPDAVRAKSYLEGPRYLLARRDAGADRLLLHPGLDYWLYLWEKHFTLPCPVRDWHLQMGLLQCFAASLALQRGEKRRFDSVLDPGARLFLFGTPFYAEFPASLARRPARLFLGKGGLEIRCAGGPRLAASRAELERLPALLPGGVVRRPRLGRLPEVSPGIVIDEASWLLTHCVTMHGLGGLDAAQGERFRGVLAKAFADLEDIAPELRAELCDMVRLIVPLAAPKKQSSVSSSYVNLRGVICLSHAESPVLQAETLIHEYCHQKMNQLMIVEPILQPGQSGQIFYSPWRPDARRLRGLLLGAHAFLNVARYTLAALSRESFRGKAAIDPMLNVALRLCQVETALRSLSFYGSFTEFGGRFLLGMQRELGVLHHGTQWFPRALMREARAETQKHRQKHGLFETGFHRSASLIDKIPRAPFLTPGGLER